MLEPFNDPCAPPCPAWDASHDKGGVAGEHDGGSAIGGGRPDRPYARRRERVDGVARLDGGSVIVIVMGLEATGDVPSGVTQETAKDVR